MAELTDGMLMTFQSRLLAYIVLLYDGLSILASLNTLLWKVYNALNKYQSENPSLSCAFSLKKGINLRRWELLSCHVCSLKPYIVLQLHPNHYRSSMIQNSRFLLLVLIFCHGAPSLKPRCTLSLILRLLCRDLHILPVSRFHSVMTWPQNFRGMEGSVFDLGNSATMDADGFLTPVESSKTSQETEVGCLAFKLLIAGANFARLLKRWQCGVFTYISILAGAWSALIRENSAVTCETAKLSNFDRSRSTVDMAKACALVVLEQDQRPNEDVQSTFWDAPWMSGICYTFFEAYSATCYCSYSIWEIADS